MTVFLFLPHDAFYAQYNLSPMIWWPEYLQFVDIGNFSLDGDDIRLPYNSSNLTTTIPETMQGSGIFTFNLSWSDIQIFDS
ncbi:hypothetical protein CRYUN_Cryun34aG0007800 [Craigia yunnanensis]